MIRRIKEIKEIGVFRNFTTGGPFEFSRFTVIFGFNTQGKSTLCAIFDSLALSDPSQIIKRKSIPSSVEINEHVEFKYMDLTGEEKSLIFNQSRGWNNNDLLGRLYVFDSDFIHRNIITGLEVTRDNEEHFTDFILGEEGVSLSNKIGELKKDLREKKIDLSNKKPTFVRFGDDSTLREFINLVVTEHTEDILKKKKDWETKLLGIKNSENVIKLPTINFAKLDVQEKLIHIVSDTNIILSKAYEEVTKAAVDRMDAHIKKHNFPEEDAYSWLEDGDSFRNKKINECPFCGQKLESASVKELIMSYSTFFGEEYKKFSEDLNLKSQSIIDELEDLSLNNVVELKTQALIAASYKDYISEMDVIINSFQEESAEVKLLEDEIKIKLESFLNQIKVAIEKKDKQPHISLEKITIPKDLMDNLTSYSSKYNLLKEVLEKVKKEIDNLKLVVKGKNEQGLEIVRKQYEAEIKKCETQLARIAQEKECSIYKDATLKILEQEGLIKEKTKKLEEDQSEYLKNYFSELNKIFQRLGSKDFELFLQKSERGDKKIYKLFVKYEGKEISSENLAVVLSESDKRGLAFAIFLTKLSSISDPENSVIILDDPVVSFDDHRIISAVDEIKKLSEKHSQVIVLTHYVSLIRRFDKVHINNIKYLSLDRQPETSLIKELNLDDFILSPYQLAFNQIFSCAQGNHDKDVVEKCRIYIEEFLRLKYIKELKEKNINIKDVTLGDLILQLADNNIITTEIKTELERYKNSLDPEHHEFPEIGNDPQAISTYARGLLEYLHKL